MAVFFKPLETLEFDFGDRRDMGDLLPQAGGDPLVIEITGTDSVWGARDDLLGGKHAVFESAAMPMRFIIVATRWRPIAMPSPRSRSRSIRLPANG